MALAIFALSYLFISGARIPGLRIDRTGGALLGAALMLVFRIVSPSQLLGHSSQPADRAIDGDTLVLLFGMMLLSAYLSEAGFFRIVGSGALRWSRSPRTLLAIVLWTSGAISAFLVNDTVCVMFTPLVLAVVRAARLSPRPYLLALCMGANAGSVATFTGNPQNMLIGTASGLAYGRFAAFMLLPALGSLAAVWLVLSLSFGRELRQTTAPPHPATVAVEMERATLWLSLAGLCGIVAAFFAGLPMSWSAVVGAVGVMALARAEPRRMLERVDYVLLVFFAALFVVVFGLNHAGWGERLRDLFGPFTRGSGFAGVVGFSALSLVGSNLLSNVPFVMIARQWVPAMAQPELSWQVLALASTLAGNLTLIGSVANLIVLESARDEVQVGFWEYFRVGAPATLLSLGVGVSILWLEHAWL